jgi:hypothetical protein
LFFRENNKNNWKEVRLMKRIKRLMVIGLITAFAAFFVLPGALFASYIDYATITGIDVDECGGSTEICIEIDWGPDSAGRDTLYVRLNLGLVGDCPGLVYYGPMDPEESRCFDAGVLAEGDYLVTLKTYESDGSSQHEEAYDEEYFTVGECVPESGTIGVEKVDGNGDPLTGAGFTLYNSDKSIVVVAEKIVDAAGKVAFEHLPMGTYIVSETTVPAGYSGEADKEVVINDSNVNKVVNVIMENTRETPPPEEEEEETGEVGVLAFTGQNPLLYIMGLLLMAIAGCLVFSLRTVRNRK